MTEVGPNETRPTAYRDQFVSLGQLGKRGSERPAKTTTAQVPPSEAKGVSWTGILFKIW